MLCLDCEPSFLLLPRFIERIPTTLDREDLDRGAEPDNAYYIQNQPRVAGRTVNLQQYPPPDLVVEVDITHTDIAILAGVLNFLPQPSPKPRGGSKKFTNDLGLLYQ